MSKLSVTLSAAIILLLAFASAARGEDDKAVRLCDFENDSDLKAWSFTCGTPKLTDQGIAHGKAALEITFDPRGQYHPAYMSWNKPRRDWSGYDALLLEVINPLDHPISASLLIADQAWTDSNRSYWNRHNSSMTFAPGKTTWVIPVGGLYRGEAGSRNNDIKRNIDVNSIIRVDFGFGNKGDSGSVIIDDLRMVKVARPAGVWAFDFGPADQSVMLGWTGVSNRSAYRKEVGYGWWPAGGVPWEGAARDTTFGPALIRDFCAADGCRFRVDVPPGQYAVTIIYENSGDWGGEQAMQSVRRVLVDGKEVFSQKRPDGQAHSLYRFENIEPVGADIWDTYMKTELAQPVQFDVRAAGDGLTLQFDSDRPWGSRLAAMVIHKSDDAVAAKWQAKQMDELAREFRGMAVCLDKPAGEFTLPAAWKDYDLAAWRVDLDDEVTPNSLPPANLPDPAATKLSALAARGETAAFCLAVRSIQDQQRAAVRFEWTEGPAKPVFQINRVWYNTSRGFGTIAYHIRGQTLRSCDSLPLGKGITRELVVNVTVSPGCPPGEYRGRLTIKVGKAQLAVPVSLKVSPVTLDRRSDFRMGFFGLMPPPMIPANQQQAVLEQTLDLLKDHGMNMVCGGPDWTLKGWKDGQPIIDFARVDSFMALLKKHGFTGPVNGYGGLRLAGLHEGYQKGDAAARVAKESGLAYEEAFMRAWKAVDEHARANDWPVIWYAMCDETRVRQTAEKELEFMQLMAKATAAFPKTVRASGSYSVNFAQKASDPADMTYWEQKFFGALDISDLNLHDDSVMSEAAKLGKDVHIYNQGVDRYSFGLYQWSEYRHGVKARTQWHLSALHGYQFFDLDGREPDVAMICYGRQGVYPTMAFERCRQGAQDFCLYQTLQRRLEQARAAGKTGPAVESAGKVIDRLTDGIKLNQRRPPKDYGADAIKAEVLAAIEGLAQMK